MRYGSRVLRHGRSRPWRVNHERSRREKATACARSGSGCSFLARHVTDTRDGVIPSEPEELRALPGVGAYTAGAVASFAYEKRAALVDTNVARVLHRVFVPEIAPKSGKGLKVLWQIAEQLLPRTGKLTWTHNQALMELGALVCSARAPKCRQCPVKTVCASYPLDQD